MHQPRNMAVLRVDVRSNLLRVENEQCLIFDEPFLVLTENRQSGFDGARGFALRSDVAVDVVHDGRIECLLAFEERRDHRPGVSPQPSQPTAPLIRFQGEKLPALVQRRDLELVVRRAADAETRVESGSPRQGA